jgi:hypothetical protein
MDGHNPNVVVRVRGLSTCTAVDRDISATRSSVVPSDDLVGEPTKR